jgi:hypothetical protein
VIQSPAAYGKQDSGDMREVECEFQPVVPPSGE